MNLSTSQELIKQIRAITNEYFKNDQQIQDQFYADYQNILNTIHQCAQYLYSISHRSTKIRAYLQQLISFLNNRQHQLHKMIGMSQTQTQGNC